MVGKVVTPADAAALIRSGDTICTSGFVGIGVPEELLQAIETRFRDHNEPRDLTLFFAAGQGDGKERGLNRLGHDGLIKRVIGGHWGLIPKIGKLALENRIEGYNLPQGVISHLYREIAAGRPGVITSVGLGTFVDPRNEGGRINNISKDNLVELIELGGEEKLFYPAQPIHVALLRGTTADEAGNITMEREALVLDNLAMAMAARNSGGVVIVQVERVAARGSLCPRDVVIPAALVDAVVVAQPENHAQTFGTDYSPYFSGEAKAPASGQKPMPLSDRKVIARRCAMELPVNGVVNLGIGMPEGVAAVAAEERLLEHVTLTAEPGVIGGRPASGLDFGAATNTDAVIPQNAQFDFYDGGGLDMACLGMAQVDAEGNVNVSRFGGRLAGAGGFINISQNARKVVFAGTFRAGGLDLKIGDGRLEILSEGRSPKFIEKVEQITFSGRQAMASGKPVLYVTERAVFQLTGEGLKLIEVAPGIDIERDIVALMGFRPLIDKPREMDPGIFDTASLELARRLMEFPVSDRVAVDIDARRLFLNFQGMRVRSQADVDAIGTEVVRKCGPLGFRVDVVVNYSGFHLDPEIADAYGAMVKEMEDRFYTKVSRYTTSAFMKLKLGRTLSRDVAPHIFETKEEAHTYLEQQRG
jgi:propionate CoA-transferase